MKVGATLLTPRQRIRHIVGDETDRAFFHRMSSDEAILTFFAQRWTRARADEELDRMNGRTAENGYGWAIAEDRQTGRPIGLTGIARVRIADVVGEGHEIGWRYIPEVWGKGLATEAAKALRDHAFEDLGADRLVSFAAVGNAPSIAVMRRIGMRRIEGGDFDHPLVPDTYPHIKRHVFFEMLPGEPRPA